MKSFKTIKKQEKGKVIDIKRGERTKYTGLEVYKLEKGEKISRKAEKGEEYCAVIVTGYSNVVLNDVKYENVGNRFSVFVETPPYAVYVTEGDEAFFEATTDLEIAFCIAPGKGTHESRIIEPNMEYVQHRGKGAMKRVAKDILPETDNADSLLVVEVITEGGNWSSFPSHRHDEDDLPNQSYLEEIYYHKLDPEEGGFAFQRIYNDDKSLDEAYVVENETCVTFTEGYHPVSVPPGYNLYYLNVMAGPKRVWKFYNDPYFEKLLK